MTDLEERISIRKPTADRPLLGLTILVVEDSRYACETLRLMCLRSGARIRRADCLASAQRHLKVYRPSVVIIDMGLPDGSGRDLIAILAQASPRIGVILAISGDDGTREAALAAGADGFLEKPLDTLARFQEAVLAHLPQRVRPKGPRALPSERIIADRTALRDDIAHVAGLLESRQDRRTLDYVAQFLGGVARAARDRPLAAAAAELANCRSAESRRRTVARVISMLHARAEFPAPI